MAKVHSYSGEQIEVTFDAKRCTHSAECLKRLREVFDVNKRPWVEPANADADAIAATVEHCPSGALQYERSDGKLNEVADDVNSITVVPNGPLHVRGKIEIVDSEGEVVLRDFRMSLCRCGESRNKPFCDNTHRQERFRDDATAGKEVIQPVTCERGTLQLFASPNGSLKLAGPCEIRTLDGKVARVEKVSLCRCGHSNVKPYCDGTHKEIGFAG